ncbi:Hsp20/alpha crystallin family protein [Aneurinibacillus terranovensis]|uniref:Hsp20/alpha crystallin family protein n=1 Tax=Aneurinibacillus terranovensis TaxID=278991 RepID=UPI0004117588|nr:Hsp20/alpha crystallin family protein [Aneurinibacillus terranovensis]
MSLIPYEPFRHLENMRREIDRFFPTDFPFSAFRSTLGNHFGNPSIDIHETETEIVATCDIPGLEKKEDVNIDVDNNMLTISGSINRTNEIKEEHMHRQERFCGRFQRSVALPSRVNSEGVKATYKNGVLEIHMPKLKADTKKRIDVEFH